MGTSMTRQGSRITLVASPPTKPDLDWRVAAAGARIAFVATLNALRFALDTAFSEVGLDIERVVVDRAGTADDFLDLLSQVPSEFVGDIVFLRDDRAGYLSAMGRGGDRVLYSLTARDVRFYLEAHDLVTGRSIFHERLSA
jgi:hypothetical protein